VCGDKPNRWKRREVFTSTIIFKKKMNQTLGQREEYKPYTYVKKHKKKKNC
jgi:hypothetical protein